MQQPVNWMPPMKSWLSATTNNRASLTTVLTTPPCKSKSYRASRVLWLGGNFVAGATISWKLLRVVVDWGEVAVVCLPVCYTTLRPAAAAWLESQVWTTSPKTVTPGSCQAFSPIFQLFRSCWYFFGAADTFSVSIQSNTYCLRWFGFLGEVLRTQWWRTEWSGWRRRRGGTQNWTKYSR